MTVRPNSLTASRSEFFGTGPAAVEVVRALRFGPETKVGVLVDPAVRLGVDVFGAAELEQHSSQIEDERAHAHRAPDP